MKARINKNEILEQLIDVVVITAIVTFLWNLILPGITGLPAISFWIVFSVVLGIYALRYLYKSRLADDSESSVVTSDSSII